jgi:hypothetical protein
LTWLNALAGGAAHDRMPDLHLTRPEMDDLIAYILSLRQ